MSQLKVYKASAGSGKTFRLAVDYLKLILKNEFNYRHILAVTFTNKATAEMKSRVLEELYQLSRGEKTAYLEVLVDELQMQEMQIAEKSQKALKRILHDYSRFSISTIDSFFQRIIKAFNRELGINSAYSVELDEKQVLDEAVDRLILSVEEDLRLRAWLKEFAENKIQEGQGWNLKNDIMELGQEIYNDLFRTLNEELYNKLNDRQFIADYRSELNKIIHTFEKTLIGFGKGGQKIIQEYGLTTEDFKGKSRGVSNSFNKLADKKFEFTATAIKASDDIESWHTKTADDKVKQAANEIMPVLSNAINYFDKNISDYNTARAITEQLYVLGILVDLRKMVREICKEKGIVMISDSGQFINEIIEDSDTPFLYEKTGVFFNHFMIDEFQDTSGLQWDNFKPLILNSMADNNFNLVVGDVKQAIYRWRKGDWKLLAHGLDEAVGHFGIENQILNNNWRSSGNIIKLNNSIFTAVPQVIQNIFDHELDVELDIELMPIAQIYEDRIQHIGKKEIADEGYFRFKFLEPIKGDKETNIAIVEAELVQQIKDLQDQGVAAGKMAVLVRAKREAKVIADLFLEQKNNPENSKYNFNVLSNESLYLNNSKLINFLIVLLQYYLNSDDQVALSTINYLYYSHLYPVLFRSNSVPVFVGDENQQTLLDFTVAYHPDIMKQFEELPSEDNGLINYVTSEEFSQRISGKSLQEIIYSICEKFNLFKIQDELAYLQAFIDQIGVFEKKNSSELTSFLEWWEENKNKITIPVSDTIDAISILTIHKSKGLEFDYVFMPYCDWGMQPTGKQASLMWCKPQQLPFSSLELVPVKYKKELKQSIFVNEYFEEMYNNYIDNLNLLYVAFTRAKSALFVWSKLSSKMDNVGDVLLKAVDYFNADESDELLNPGMYFDKETMLLEYGEIKLSQDKKDSKVNNVLLSEFQFGDFRRYLSIRKNTTDFIGTEKKTLVAVNKGKIIHEILSAIKYRDELQSALQQAVFSGKILNDELGTYKAEIEKMLDDPEIESWFNGSYEVLNERNILSGSSQKLKRPDRIMLKEDETIVVDYKSGDKELDKYKYQLRSYMGLLSKCGYANIKGIIWYTKTNTRIQV